MCTAENWNRKGRMFMDMRSLIDSINAHLRAAEVADPISALGELNYAMSLVQKLPYADRWPYEERAKDIAIAKNVPLRIPD